MAEWDLRSGLWFSLPLLPEQGPWFEGLGQEEHGGPISSAFSYLPSTSLSYAVHSLGSPSSSPSAPRSLSFSASPFSLFFSSCPGIQCDMGCPVAEVRVWVWGVIASTCYLVPVVGGVRSEMVFLPGSGSQGKSRVSDFLCCLGRGEAEEPSWRSICDHDLHRAPFLGMC